MNPTCPYCKKSDNVVKYGKRKCYDQIKQKYHCNKCERHFIDERDYAKMKGGRHITNVMVDLHSRGLSLRQIRKHLENVYKLKVTHTSVMRRIKKFKVVKNG